MPNLSKTTDNPQKMIQVISTINENSKKIARKYKNRKFMTLKNLPFDFDIFLPKAIRFFSESTVKKSFINVHLLPEVNVVRHARRFKLEFQFINPNMKVFRYTLGKPFFFLIS